MIALQEGRRAFADAYTLAPRADSWASVYDMRWAYFANTLFDHSPMWAPICDAAGLYRHTRPIYNPVKRGVDLLAGAIYPGVLSEDGAALPEGIPLAIPLTADTPPELRRAVAQLWQWSNFQAQKGRLVRWGAVLGDVLVEIRDDVTRGRISFDLIWPGDVTDLILDAQGNVKQYAVEYPVRAEDGTLYQYRCVTTRESVSTFRDGQPAGYQGQPPVIALPYGFVPAVWVRHQDIGNVRGAPQFYGTAQKIPKLMELASLIFDQTRKQVNPPILLASGESIANISGIAKRDDSAAGSDPETMLLLKAGLGATAKTLLADLNLADALHEVEMLLAEIEKDQPILRLYEQLRGMSQVTGPAAERLVGDVANPIYELQATYDSALISLFRMAVAMGGMRWALGQGGWAARTAQQARFAPFNLDSYGQGALNLAIAPRPLLPPTVQERQQQRSTQYTGIQAAVAAGIPLPLVLAREGWGVADLAALDAAQGAADARAARLLGDGFPPPSGPIGG